MPKLLLFAACEKVIVNETDNTTSLISLLEAINIAVVEGEESKIPSDASIPLSWHVLSLWQSEPADEGKRLEQRFYIELPDGEAVNISGTMPIGFEPNKPNFRGVIGIMGFPLAPLLKTKRVVLKLDFREVGTNPWKSASEYSIHITRRPADIVNLAPA